MFTIKRLQQLFIFMLLVLGFQIVIILNAQAECEALVSSGFSNLSDACGTLPGSSACTSDSGEVLSISDIDTLTTSTSDDAVQVAAMNVSANVPLGLAEEGMRLFVIGNATIENAVDPETALEPSAGATVSTIVGANIRSIPSADGRLVTAVPVGTELAADGLSSDLQWVHVFTDEGTAWISRQIITTVDGDLDSLPVINVGTRTLWQDLFLTTTASEGCGDAFPSMLYIQGPDNMLASMTINNNLIRINSDIALTIDESNVMRLYTIEGIANADGISVPAGFTMSIQLSEDGQDRNGSWTNLRPIEENERDFLTGLQLLPENVLYHPVEIPSQTEVSELLAQINQATAGAGQTVVTAAGQGVVNCGGFQPTFPLEAVAPGLIQFYWDGAPGADTYNLNFYDVGGAFLGNVSVDALNPTTSVDPGTVVGGRGQFAWAVDAVVNGQVACTTGQAIIQRVSGQITVQDSNDEPAPEPTKCRWNDC